VEDFKNIIWHIGSGGGTGAHWGSGGFRTPFSEKRVWTPFSPGFSGVQVGLGGVAKSFLKEVIKKKEGSG
jgi:hypothetical protein